MNIANGGLINKHRNFAEFCDNPLSVEKQMELVKNDGKYLEYRLPVERNNVLKGYIHLGIEDTFAVVLYCKAISTNGYIHKGLMRELQNWQQMGYNEFNDITGSMMRQMASTHEFTKLQFD